MVVAYLLLALAIVSEVIGTISLKMSEGFTKLVPTIFVIVGYLGAFIALGLGLKNYIQQQFENLGANLVIVMP